MKHCYFIVLFICVGLSHPLFAEEGKLGTLILGGNGTNSGATSSVETDEFTGAAQYTVPISVPPGKGSVTPNISLNYNSYRKNTNSWVGYGWELELGSIVRLKETVGNNSSGDVDYQDGKKFEVRLGGQSEALILVKNNVNPSDYGLQASPEMSASLYQSQVESAFTYFLLFRNTKDNFDQQWVAIDKSGTSYYFGSTTNSRDDIKLSFIITFYSGVSGWYLDKVIDANGNQMTIEYDATVLPEKIKYTDVEITFEKEDILPDGNKIPYFPVFNQITTPIKKLTQVLREIRVTASNNLLNRYQLTYQISGLMRHRQLTKIQQFGQDDSASLPPLSFTYYGEEDLAFSDKSETSYARNTGSGDVSMGFVEERSAFADMNGDGLVDHIVAKPEGGFKVFFNNGNDFVDVPGQSDWDEPFPECKYASGDNPACAGKVNGYKGSHQYLFLMDINGDGLPDRFGRVFGEKINGSEQAYFRIALNTGHGWDPKTVEWKDPYKGDWSGTIDENRGFYDMNGDGLVDRIVGDTTGNKFDVWYNTGVGFKKNPVFWKDPAINSNFSNKAGLLYYSEGDNTYLFIRDMNGDGLPDRVVKTDFDEVVGGTGFAIMLNQNGEGWAQPKMDNGKPLVNGIDVLGIIDPVEGNSKGALNDNHDWIDINGDGFLDRVEGDQNAKVIRVFFYRGMTYSEFWGSLSAPQEIPDPIQDGNGVDSEFNATGFLTNKNKDPNPKTSVFFQDFNGDGLPDRMAIDWGGGNTPTGKYQFYPMRHNAVTFSDSPNWWLDKNVNQPLGALSYIDDERGSKMAIEYQPSTWRLFEQQEPNHRYLPFNLNVVHKLYSKDPSFNSGLFPKTVPEAQRNSGMRWVTYEYRGGNFFVKHAIKSNPDDINDDQISAKSFVRFNGFQKVKKTPIKAPNETWQPYSTTTWYHQAEGDVDPTGGNVSYWFDMGGYKNHAFSGRPYRTVMLTGEDLAYLDIREKSDWELVEYTAESDEKYWWPRLATQTKIIKDATALDRVTKTDYQYDEDGNIIQETVSANGQEVMVKKTQYYPAGNFSNKQIRDRPMEQTKSLNGTTYRTKNFNYDTTGNPTEEKSLTNESGTQALTVSRSFSSAGNMKLITDVDQVKKELTYSSDLFPTKEKVVGTNLTTMREFDRRTGEISQEVGPQGVGKRTEFDSFARPLKELVIAANGDEKEVRKYTYDYKTYNAKSFPTEGIIQTVTALKTQAWELRGDTLDFDPLPTTVRYTDNSGLVLQECSRAENEQYRMIQRRSLNAGQVELATEPVYRNDCEFVFDLDEGVPHTRIEKDLMGRVTLIDPPDGDSASPVGNTTISYANTPEGYLRKTIINPKGQVQVETYDTTDHLIKIVDPGGGIIAYSYNPIGDLLKVVGDGKTLTEMTYDQLGRKTQMTDADMGTWTYAYDEKGRLSEQQDAKGQRIQFFYDNLSRIIKKEFSKANGAGLEKYETYEYDSSGLLSGFDVQEGELYRVTEYTGSKVKLRSTRFSYDPLYRRTVKLERHIEGVGDFTQTLEHNLLGQVINTDFPGGHQLTYEYMLTGNLKRVCHNKCDTAEVYYSLDPKNAYDLYGNLLQESYGNGVNSTYSYYPKSHQLEEKQTLGSDGTLLVHRHYTHDELSNIGTIQDPLKLGGFSGGISATSYDNLNRLSGYTLESGKSGTLTYDKAGNILKNSAAFGDKDYQYHAEKVHQVIKIGDDTFDYDANGNMIKDPHRDMVYNVQNQLAAVSMKNGIVVGYDYDYTGARVAKTVTKTDPMNNVTTEVTHFLGDAMELRGQQLILHIFAGSRKVATRVLASDYLSPTTAASASLIDNGITTRLDLPQVIPYFVLLLTLFLLGSLKPAPVFVGANPCVRPQWWADTWVFPYMSKIRSLYHAWCSYRRSLQEALVCFPKHVYAKSLVLFLILLSLLQPPALLFAGESGQEAPNSNDPNYFYYIHDDHLGSSQLLTEGKDTSKHSGFTYKKGQILQRFEYAPFGQEIYALNPNLKFDPSYTGQTYDIETGLYYYKARYYNPILGRFIQPDTFVQDAKDLQSYNRYSYVRNNPLNLADPSGHFSWKKFWGAFFGGLVAGLTYGLLFPFVGPVLATLAAGVLGGATAGGIMGGAKGALMGAAFGGLTAVGALLVSPAIVSTIGLVLSIKNDGWAGFIYFEVGMLGAYAGNSIGSSWAMRIQMSNAGNSNVESGHQLTYRPGRAHFDYKQSGLLAANDTPMSDAGTGYGLGGGDQDYGWFRPEGHDYVVGRKEFFIEAFRPGKPMMKFIDDYVPGGHSFGINHDAYVDFMRTWGAPDWYVNIPSMPAKYIISVGEEFLNSSVNGINSISGTSWNIPFKHAD